MVTTTLVGFASLPADTFAAGPPTGQGISANGRTGPFASPPVQGFSGVQFAEQGNYWFLSDNGFGNKTNSTDYPLRIYRLAPNFRGSGGDASVNVLSFIQFSDPDRKIPFPIQNENTAERVLTGGDFDPESFVIAADGTIWVGDEFGPYLLQFDATGKLLQAPIPTPNLFELKTLNQATPLVIGHRGASGILPEHTLEAYRLAIAQGADFIEPDLVITKDGILIARHEPYLSSTTDVASRPEFANRRTTKLVDGVSITDWFAEDFTLAEIKTLRAVQPFPDRDQSFNGQFQVPTLAEVIDLVKQVEAETGRKIGIYPETKHPTYFDQQGLSLEEPLVQTLVDKGFTDPNRIFIQSFEIQNLIELKTKILPAQGLEDIPLVQLLGDFTQSFLPPNSSFSRPFDVFFNFSRPDFTPEKARAIYGDLVDLVDLKATTHYGELATPEVLRFINTYADGIGPWKNSFLLRRPLTTPVDGNGDGVAEIRSQLTGEVLPLIQNAHAAGLLVHPYTLRNEERTLVLNPDGTPQTPEQETLQLIQLGADGFFTDFPETGDRVRDSLVFLGGTFEGQVEAGLVRSPDHPDVLARRAPSNLPRSRGYEGMAFSPDKRKLYPMLEGSVVGDPNVALRIYEFDPQEGTFTGLTGLYRMEAPAHAIGDFTVINDGTFLVIERDGGQGETARFKKVFKIDLTQTDAQGYFLKQEVVDLLNIQDPNDLNGDGSTTFSFPFVTIENVLVIDAETILVSNDNNFPFSVGRPPAIDNNEVILVKLAHPLDLDPRVGLSGFNRNQELIGNAEANLLIAGSGDDVIYGREGDDLIFAGGGVNTVYGEQGHDRIETGSGDDLIFGGAGNDIISAGTGKNTINAGRGDNVILSRGIDDITVSRDGANRFDLVAGAGVATIRGFTSDDRISLGGGLTASDLTTSRSGRDTLLTVTATGDLLAVLKEVQPSTISRATFV
ncbi:MAG TPA: esterase-like activity of phytase family protein [Synechococcales cyanobacterium M55_K2018_004]|nr:esterase-like activity of phytase family protein [Synechococcales cyanobacterium M55_K2018_004]